MSLDTLDPNEPENYSNSQEVLGQSNPDKPVTNSAKNPVEDIHPVLSVLGSYLKRFSIVERWTVMEDLLEKTIEVRLTLSRPAKK